MSPSINIAEYEETHGQRQTITDVEEEVTENEIFVQNIAALYKRIITLETLKPCPMVDAVFSELVKLCTTPVCIDVDKLSKEVKEIRWELIKICGEAETHLEIHYSDIIAEMPAQEDTMANLQTFPYYSNYMSLASMEFQAISDNMTTIPTKVAFVGSGPMPLTSIILAKHMMPFAFFDNYDKDEQANSMASKLITTDPDLCERLKFHTQDVMDLCEGKIEEYDLVMVAALVGIERAEKLAVIDHLGRNMKYGSALLVRSSHGPRSFLYPIVHEDDVASKFAVLDTIHPTNEVINSIILALKVPSIHTVHDPPSTMLRVEGPLG